MRYEGDAAFVKPEEEMRALLLFHIREAIENTGKNRGTLQCHNYLRRAQTVEIDVPEGYDSWSYLNMLCRKGLKEKYSHVTSVHAAAGP